MRGLIYMRSMWQVVFVAALTIACFGLSLTRQQSLANAAENSVTAKPAITAGGVSSGGTAVRSTVKPGIYVVRTVWKNAPVSKVRVEWRYHPEDPAPVLTGNTIRFGTAIFRPESGTYYLTAEWRQDENFARPRKPGDRFAWLGGNPVLVSSEISEVITLSLEEIPPVPPSQPAHGTGISGLVTLAGVPVANVGVYAYAKSSSGFKGDDFQGFVRSNAKGEFILDLPPGRYYLLARLRGDNSVDLGPLHKEDMLGYDPMNPVVVEKGRYVVSAIPAMRLKMVKSRIESSAFLPGTIEGRIVDQDGRPVPGAYAALYEKPKMIGRSVFRSEPAGADGRFKLFVPIPGNYFLGARSGYGSPLAGSWSGTWGGSNHSITVKSGESHIDLEITVNRLTQDMKHTVSQ